MCSFCRISVDIFCGIIYNNCDDDWFGNGVTFYDETEDSVFARVKLNLKAARFLALQYAPYVTVLSPQSLVEQIRKDLEDALQDYEAEFK